MMKNVGQAVTLNFYLIAPGTQQANVRLQE